MLLRFSGAAEKGAYFSLSAAALAVWRVARSVFLWQAARRYAKRNARK
jgi:hypothetical protein